MSNPRVQSARPTARTSARADLNRIESASRPWWTELPRVASLCAALIVAPARIFAVAAETAVNVAFLAAIGTLALWYFRFIPDAAVAAVLGQIGDRALGILEGSGLL
jgi:hypothetical protein